MAKTVQHYVESCMICARSKRSTKKPAGLLKPLEAPPKPWYSVSMDYIMFLPLSETYDAILVIVDRFSKYSIFVPCNSNIDAIQTAKLFVEHVFCLLWIAL